MDKLPMCRICLVENVRMYVVVNKSLHELYEKLTDVPFVTEDSRPILACSFCCAKLKQCFRFMRKCLEAEELFTQMMEEDYEPNPSMNIDHLEFCSGFRTRQIELISIVDGCQTESIAVKEELPDVCEGQDDIIEPKEEYLSDDSESDIPLLEFKTEVEEEQVVSQKKQRAEETNNVKPKNLDNTGLGIEDMLPHISDSDSESDVPLTEFKTEVEEEKEVSQKKRRAEETNNVKPKNLDNTGLGIEDMLPHISDSDSESDVPLTEFKTEVEEEKEVSQKKRRAEETNNVKPKNLDNTGLGIEDMLPHISDSDSESDVPLTEFKTEVEEEKEVSQKNRRAEETNRTPVTKKAKLDTRRSKQEDTITSELEKNEQSYLKVMETTQNHTGEKPFKCNVCQRSFKRSDELTKHIRIHTGEKPFKCNICQRSFTQNSPLKRHIRIHTGEKPFKCNICQRSFTQNSLLKRHIRIHTGEKPFKCDICQRGFARNSDLTTHIRIHTSEKPFKCHLCPRSFSRKNFLTTHNKVHTGENPFKCNICQRSFTQNSHIKRHIRTHTGEKPFKCNVCQRSFERSDALTRHIRIIHTGEKHFKCDVCQRSFSIKSNLSQHIRIHAGEKS